MRSKDEVVIGEKEYRKRLEETKKSSDDEEKAICT